MRCRMIYPALCILDRGRGRAGNASLSRIQQRPSAEPSSDALGPGQRFAVATSVGGLRQSHGQGQRGHHPIGPGPLQDRGQ